MKHIRTFIAYIRRTFVTDCPRCHQYFYGFHPYGLQLNLDGRHFRIVCHNCAHRAKEVSHG